MPQPESVTIIPDERALRVGDALRLKATGPEDAKYKWSVLEAPSDADRKRAEGAIANPTARETTLETRDLSPGSYTFAVERTDDGGATTSSEHSVSLGAGIEPIEAIRRSVEKGAESGLPVNLASAKPTSDQALWSRIRACLEKRNFDKYRKFIDRMLCDPEERERLRADVGGNRLACVYTHGVHGYALLKAATEVYLLCHACCGGLPRGGEIESEFSDFDPLAESARLGYVTTAAEMRVRLKDYLDSSVTPGTLPYLGKIIGALQLSDFDGAEFPFCSDSVLGTPCLFELIWSYWHEEGMLVQALNAISLRFQNRRVLAGGRDALANLELHPLRPLNNLLWGYIQDEGLRLSVRRRTYEYEHHYGLRLLGKAVGVLDVAERRSKFLEAFHNVLHRAAVFYADRQNLMMKPDAFPLLEAIRAVHLLLAEGAHNQFGDLPSTARAEMLIQQWLLAQPPMREFLQTRAMVPYEEDWMGPVDAMKKLMGWSDVTIIHFHKLAVYGEKILLSIRFGNWNAVNTTADQAENWVNYFKPEIQGYIESYRAATGIDLSPTARAAGRVDATLPAVLLDRRLKKQGTTAP